MVGRLFGSAVFSETALRIFLIFCMKLEDYKGRKVTQSDFWKKFLIWRYLQKRLQISPKSDTDIFLKNSSDDFFGFWPEVSTKCDLQFEWNHFFRKICYLEIFDLEIVVVFLQFAGPVSVVLFLSSIAFEFQRHLRQRRTNLFLLAYCFAD